MREASRETKLKYLEALKELREMLKYTSNISVTKFLSEKNINGKACKELVGGGILKNIGGSGKGARYKWDSIEPNIRMAEELIARTKAVKAAKSNKVIDYPKNINVANEPILDTRIKFSVRRYFFGIIKIRTEYFY